MPETSPFPFPAGDSQPRLALPEQAIAAFEQIHRLHVTVHDLAGTLRPFIQPYRFHHCSELCLAVKAQGQEDRCIQFEVRSLRPLLATLPEGRIHVCHAGLVEWMVPVFSRDRLAWVFFAGPRMPAPSLASALRAQLTQWETPPWNARRTMAPPVSEKEAQLILECLRQLAARLQLWASAIYAGNTAPGKSPDAFTSSSMTRRQVAIMRFIERHYHEGMTLGMLAAHLCLSESRTSHAVRLSCGVTFRELLVQRRLRAAMELLRDTGMSVLQTAMSTGFADVAHFHRLFRKRIGMTPVQYRRMGTS
ncbi:MAG: helix-turn-helix domain-containing protein [Opitutaceae bacterium]|nr:helix-turn-helix domain-containing protein [Opitutaceae bacterium]